MFLSGTLNGTKTSVHGRKTVKKKRKREIIIKIGQDETAVNFHGGEKASFFIRNGEEVRPTTTEIKWYTLFELQVEHLTRSAAYRTK